MRKALANTYGSPAPEGVQVVRVGDEGQCTHALNPHDPKYGRIHLCRSGIKHDKVPTLYASNSKFFSCYRCGRLIQMNLKRYGTPLPPVG